MVEAGAESGPIPAFRKLAASSLSRATGPLTGPFSMFIACSCASIAREAQIAKISSSEKWASRSSCFSSFISSSPKPPPRPLPKPPPPRGAKCDSTPIPPPLIMPSIMPPSAAPMSSSILISSSSSSSPTLSILEEVGGGAAAALLLRCCATRRPKDESADADAEVEEL